MPHVIPEYPDRLKTALAHFCQDTAFEIREFQASRLTSFKTLLVRAERLLARIYEPEAPDDAEAPG